MISNNFKDIYNIVKNFKNFGTGKSEKFYLKQLLALPGKLTFSKNKLFCTRKTVFAKFYYKKINRKYHLISVLHFKKNVNVLRENITQEQKNVLQNFYKDLTKKTKIYKKRHFYDI